MWTNLQTQTKFLRSVSPSVRHWCVMSCRFGLNINWINRERWDFSDALLPTALRFWSRSQLMYVVYNGGVLTLEEHLDAACLRGLPVEVTPYRSLAFVGVRLPQDLCVIKHDGLSSQTQSNMQTGGARSYQHQRRLWNEVLASVCD